MSTERSIQAVLADWPEWRDAGLRIDKEPTFLKAFEDGLKHDVALLGVSHQKREDEQVLKCFAAEHASAIKAQQWASQLGIAPRVNYVDTDFTYCVMDYLKAESLSLDSLSTTDLSNIAVALNTFHSEAVPEFASALGLFDILNFCEHYLVSAGEQACALHQKLIKPLNRFMSDTTPMCFCHNDLVVGNCFIMDGQAQLIDWEYAQLNNPWFDLAAVIYYLQLDDKQAAEFLDDYQAGWSVFVGTPIFYTAQLSLLWVDMLWHLAKFGPEFWPRLEVKLNDLEQLLKISKSLA